MSDPITHVVAVPEDNIPCLVDIINHTTEEHTSEAQWSILFLQLLPTSMLQFIKLAMSHVHNGEAKLKWCGNCTNENLSFNRFWHAICAEVHSSRLVEQRPIIGPTFGYVHLWKLTFNVTGLKVNNVNFLRKCSFRNSNYPNTGKQLHRFCLFCVFPCCHFLIV